MRAALLIVIAACGSAKPAPAPPATTSTPLAAPMRCADLRGPVERVVAADLASMPADARKQPSIAELQAWFSSQMIQACTSDGWTPDVIACIARGKTTDDWNACKLTPAQMEAFQARFASGPGPARSYDLAPDLGIAACDDYLRLIARALGCASLDESGRDQLRATADEQKRQWRAMPRATAADEQKIAASCALNRDALVKVARADGCAL